MIQEIRYSGQTVIPSDYDAPDGSLAISLNLLSQRPGSSLAPLPNPASIFKIPEGYNLQLIHRVADVKYFIFSAVSDAVTSFYWATEESLKEADGDDSVLNLLLSSGQSFIQIKSIGNVLVFALEKSTHYAIWREGDYVYLGERPPFVPMDFRLSQVTGLRNTNSASINMVQGLPERKFNIETGEWEAEKVTAIVNPQGNGVREVDKWRAIIQSSEDVEKFNDAVFAAANSLVADIQKRGLFCMPFLMRYALKLFDGSYICHSSPVLMFLPSMLRDNLKCTVGNVYSSEQKVDVVANVTFTAAKLQWNALPGKWSEMLDVWSDLITSLEVFVSAPLYTYDQSGKFGYLTHHFRGAEDDNVAIDINNGEWCPVPFPKVEQSLSDRIVSASSFYNIASIPWTELKRNETCSDLTLRVKDLTSLVTFPTLEDDFRSRSKKIFSSLFPYNGRLTAVNRITMAAPPIPFRVMAHYINTPFETEYETVSDDRGRPYERPSWVSRALECSIDIKAYCEISSVGSIVGFSNDVDGFINEAISSKCTVWLDKENNPYIQWPVFLVYPDPAAKYMRVTVSYTLNGEDYSVQKWFPLKAHDFLNTAYWIHYDIENIISEENPKVVVEDTVPPEKVLKCDREGIIEPNKLLISSVNNPFHFPVESINTIGTGQILGISSAAKALSQGQFGQFPLYAFTTEGVWAMEVSATGTYSARQPITRDVCINPEGITQIDSAVLFPTDRGIMLISGSETQCISDSINTDTPFDFISLPGARFLHSLLGSPGEQTLKLIPFTEFLRTCRMIYDYTHQRIIVYTPCESAITPPWENEDSGAGQSQQPSGFMYAYVFSLQTNSWGLMQTRIADGIDSYPRALAVDTGNTILDFSQEDDENLFYPGLIVSRPLKLGAPDVLKTIDTVIQHGEFAEGHVQSVLYGSRDLIHWHLVSSSRSHRLRGFRGSPYKFFRLALLCGLDRGESISGAAISFTPRLTNRLR